MTNIKIPSQTSTTKDYPMTIRMSLSQRRTVELLAAVQGYKTASGFVRDLLSNAAEQMTMKAAA